MARKKTRAAKKRRKLETVWHGVCWVCKHVTTGNYPDNICPKCGKDAMDWS
jgi:rubrerythrin